MASPAAFAQEIDYFDMQPHELLQAEVISASKKIEKVSKTSAAVYVISSDDIQRSGVTTIPDALRMAPGVHVAQADSNSWAITIRGFNNELANKLLVMIDGRAIYNPLFSGTYWESEDLLFEDIERIEVIRGPGGALWGANAVNGVINIITKRAEDTQGNLLSAAYGNHERGLFGARHGGAFGDDGYYRIYAKQFTRDTMKSANRDNSNDGWNSYRSGFRVDWSDEFTLQGDVYSAETDQFVNDLSLTQPFVNIREETTDIGGANILGRWNRHTNGGGLLSVKSYLDYSFRSDHVLLNDERVVFNFETQYNLPRKGRHEIIVGAGYRYTDSMEESAGLITLDPEGYNDHLFNVFGQDTISLLPEELLLTLGAKIEHNEYTGFEFEPNVRISWYPDESQTFWSAVSRSVRTPNRLERDATARLVSGAGPLLVSLLPNPDFDSEELTAYEIGYRNQVTSDFALDLTAFYNDYDNLEAVGVLPAVFVNNGVDPAHVLIPLIINNRMHGETYGFEAAVEWAVDSDWALSGTYSYLEMELHNEPGGVGDSDIEGRVPQQQFGLSSSWNINEDWMLDAAAYYVDNLPTDNVKDYVRVDLNLGWQMNDNLRFNLIGQNLAGKHREFDTDVNYNASKPGTSVFGKLTWEF